LVQLSNLKSWERSQSWTFLEKIKKVKLGQKLAKTTLALLSLSLMKITTSPHLSVLNWEQAASDSCADVAPSTRSWFLLLVLVPLQLVVLLVAPA
jgi:hypothetical protein